MNAADFANVLKIRYPILQGPFGGGLSSAKLVSTVSNLGGLGGYGAYQLAPNEIVWLIREIKQHTKNPFNINLWVNDVDLGAACLADDVFSKTTKAFKPFFDALNIPFPSKPEAVIRKFEKQVEALLSAKPAVFSFVFGIPSEEILKECHNQGIFTIGAATTLDEAQALEAAGVGAVVASGFEAGGHRPSFLKPARDSLHGTFALVQQLSKKISVPIIAAGGIVDSVGVEAAMKLGAVGVQVGTAFLACDESGASPEYRRVLFSERARHTSLTTAFTGRLGRGISGAIAEQTTEGVQVLPFPLQTRFMAPLRKAAMEQHREDLLTFWAGQNVSLIEHHRAVDVMNEFKKSFS